MKIFKNILLALVILIFGASLYAYRTLDEKTLLGGPSVQNFVKIQPFVDNTYDNGSVSLAWRNLFTYKLTFSTTTSGCLQGVNGVTYFTGTNCGGVAATYPISSVITSDTSGNLIATGTQLTVGNLIATTTATSYLRGKLGLSTTTPFGRLGIAQTGQGIALSLSANGMDNASDITVPAPEGIRMFTGTTYGAGPAFQIWGESSTYKGIYFDAGTTAGSDINFRNGTGGTYLAVKQGTGYVGVATTTPVYPLVVASTSQPQLALSAGAGVAQYFFRNAGGNLYIGTTTVAGNATTSISALAILGSSGNVGIGTAIPTEQLEVAKGVASNTGLYSKVTDSLTGNSAKVGLFYPSGYASLPGIWFNQSSPSDTNYAFLLDGPGNTTLFNTPSGGKIQFRVNNGNVATISTLGNFGIATVTPWRTLSVTGTVGFDGLTSATNKNSVCIDAVTKEIVNAGNTTCIASSQYLKHDISSITSSEANLVLQMRPIQYVDNGDGKPYFGFIAEEVAKIDPKLAEYAQVDTTLGGHFFKKGDPISVDYTRGWVLLTKFVQDFYSKFQSLVARVSGLEAKVERQQKEIDNLQVQINQLKK